MRRRQFFGLVTSLPIFALLKKKDSGLDEWMEDGLGEWTDSIKLGHWDGPIKLSNDPYPKDYVLAWVGPIESIPPGWAECDGKEGRPDFGRALHFMEGMESRWIIKI